MGRHVCGPHERARPSASLLLTPALLTCCPLCCRLNPNNIHYDAELAERYKHMNRCGSALLGTWLLRRSNHLACLGGALAS